ncbi:MAG: hypothetical protein SO253_00595 [Bacilli bacterium]|nr:hypothetical protein [Bacilli bacterium]
MNKKKTTVKPEGRIKHMLRTNYWLTPLLLVSLVFAIVFGISKIPDLSNTIQGWFEGKITLKEVRKVSYDEYLTLKSENDGTLYVVVGQESCEACKELYPVLDKFLKANNNENQFNIIQIDVSMKDEDSFKDSTLNESKLSILQNEIKDYNNSALSSPTIIKYEGNTIKDLQVGSCDYSTLLDFFDVR